MSADSTNLASEFYILSVLHRLGLNAALTLANKKSVDIVVAGGEGNVVTIDVKGAAGTTGFFVDNQIKPHKPNHFVIFVSYLNRIHDPSVIPEVYVVPSHKVSEVCNPPSPSGKHIVHLTSLRRHIPPYRDDWDAIIRTLQGSNISQ